MATILNFPAQQKVADSPPSTDGAPTIAPTHAAKGIHTLWSAGVISTPAYAIGMQALYFLAVSTNKKSQFISLTKEQILSQYVVYDGGVLAGKAFIHNDEQFIDNLMELHYECGILNQLDLTFFNAAGNVRQHFAIPHPLRAGRPWGQDTDIHFRLDKMTVAAYEDWVKLRVDGSLLGLNRLVMTPKE